jgi:CHAT domain-containing protein
MALGDLLVGSFSSLPGTERELRSIGKLFTNPTITVASESKESYFKKVSGQYDILHLATHGFFNSSQPLYSFLLFAQDSKEDGRLTAQEIFGLDLKARLVTLSACETGLGEITHGDELVGLSRAFIYAGTPAVIVSLWSVADEPTAILMNTFYQNMRNHTIQEALTLAQREVLKKYPSPFYWAPFILIGSGTDQVQ